MWKNKTSGIYCILNMVNNKKYIGASKQIQQRLSEHKCNLIKNRHQNIYLQRAWNLYGGNNFKFEIVFKCDILELDRAEKIFIKRYKTNCRNHGYNFEDGGGAGKLISDETRRKMSRSHTGLKQTEEHKRNAAATKIGIKRKPETIKKMSESQKGYIPTEETIEKLRLSHLGKKLSPESIMKRTETRRKNGWNYNPTEETKNKISLGVKRYFDKMKKEQNG